MDNICPVHGLPFKWVAPGVSKKTGKPYQGFWSCPEMGCREKPVTEPQYPPARPAQPQPRPLISQESKMSKEDWEAKENRTNKNILLQVAFKAAVELVVKWDANGTDEAIFGQT